MKNIVFTFFCIIVVSLGTIITSKGSIVNVIAYKSRIKNCPYSGLKSNECHNPLTPRNQINDNHKYKLQLGIAYNPHTGAVGLPVLYNGNYDQNITTKNNRTYTVPNEYMMTNITTNYTFDQQLFKNRTSFNNYVYNTTKLYPNGIESNIIDLEGKFNGVSDIILTTLAYPLYNLSYKSDIHRLDDYMVEVLNMLPEEYDQEMYYEFIDQWGTDVIVSATVGGQAQRITYAKTCFVHGSSINILDQEAIRLNNQLRFKYTGNIKMDNNYEQYSSAQVLNIFGGNPIILDPTDWNKRVDSFDGEYSVFINFETKPLHHFMNISKKNNLKRAIEERYHQIDQNINIPVTTTLTNNGVSWLNPLVQTNNLTYGGTNVYDFCSMINYKKLLSPYYTPTVPQCGWSSIVGNTQLSGVCRNIYHKIVTKTDKVPVSLHHTHCTNTLNYKTSCNMDNNGYVWVSTPQGNGLKVSTGCSSYTMKFDIASYVNGLGRKIVEASDRQYINNVSAMCCIDNQFYLNNLVLDAGILQSQCKPF